MMIGSLEFAHVEASGPSTLPQSGPSPALRRLGDEIAELSAHLDAASARLLDLIRRFDTEDGWDGFRSCAEWLSWRTSLDMGAARERVRVARALGNLPRLAQALAHGELSYAKVRALTRVATPETEERLLKIGRTGTAAHVERIVRGWRWMDRKAEIDDATHQHKRRALHVYRADDGTVIVRGRLAPEVGALLIKALDAGREELYRRARVAWGAPQEDGARVSAETSQRLACDASRVVMRHDADGTLLEVGARTRTIPPALRRALQHRDPGCRFPGCHARFGQGHHIRHWAHGGPTTLSNLALLCRRHHRAVHEEGYQVERRPDGELTFRHPYGWVMPCVPPPTALPEDPVATIRARNEAEGIELDAHTAQPGWLGERLDVRYVIDVLHPLALNG